MSALVDRKGGRTERGVRSVGKESRRRVMGGREEKAICLFPTPRPAPETLAGSIDDPAWVAAGCNDAVVDGAGDEVVVWCHCW